MNVVSLGEFGVAGRVLEIPHQRSRIEKVDGGDANGIGSWQAQGSSLVPHAVLDGTSCGSRQARDGDYEVGYMAQA